MHVVSFIMTYLYVSLWLSCVQILSASSQPEVPSDGQPKLFDRIDASKLQGALSNAAVMGQLEVRLNRRINIVCSCVKCCTEQLSILVV